MRAGTGLVGGDEVAGHRRGVEVEGAGAGADGQLKAQQGGDRGGRSLGEDRVAEGIPRASSAWMTRPGRVGVGHARGGLGARIVGPAGVGVLTGDQEGERPAGGQLAQGALGDQPLDGQRGGVGVGPGVVGRRPRAGVEGAVRGGPPAVGALLGVEPRLAGGGGRRARHAGAGQGGQGQALLVVAGGVVLDLVRRCRTARRRRPTVCWVARSRATRSVPPKEVGSTPRAAASRIRRASWPGPSAPSFMHVGVEVGLQVGQGEPGAGRVDVGRRQGEHGLGGGRQVRRGASWRRGDEALGVELGGQPGGRPPGGDRLRNGGGGSSRSGRAGGPGGAQGCDPDQHGQGEGRRGDGQATDGGHGARFPGHDPGSLPPNRTETNRAPVLVSRRWGTQPLRRYPGSRSPNGLRLRLRTSAGVRPASPAEGRCTCSKVTVARHFRAAPVGSPAVRGRRPPPGGRASGKMGRWTTSTTRRWRPPSSSRPPTPSA